MVNVIPRRPRKAVARRIDSPESGEVQTDLTNGLLEAILEEAPLEVTPGEEEEEIEGEVPIVDEFENFPDYLRSVLCADRAGDKDEVTTELGRLIAQAFYDEFITGTLTTIHDHAIGLFKYIKWMAKTVSTQKNKIADLASRIDQLANSSDYDQLIKEKSSWVSSRK
ncbi:unnamed protein product [Calypogeia fissa]